MPNVPLTRRAFVERSAGGLAILIAVGPQACENTPARRNAADPHQSTNSAIGGQWLRVGQDGRVTLINDKSEMGQGVETALAMIIGDEFGVPMRLIDVEHARPSATFDDMGTSGSDSVAGRWTALRTAAARARQMLEAVAAERWRVPVIECTLTDGVVRHGASGRVVPFASLVAAAVGLAVPDTPRLKDPQHFALIGTRQGRRDTPAVVTGTKQFGMDMRLPGMLHAVLARCPSPSGVVARWSGTRAKLVHGVTHVVQVQNGIAVVGTTTWAALKGREALEIEWNESAGAHIDSQALWQSLADGFGTLEKVARRVGDAASAIGGARRQFDAEYRWPFQAHAAIEPLNATARAGEGECELWVATQNPNHMQRQVAKRLGIPTERVIVNVMPLGGGFGRRIDADYGVEAADISRAVGAPVQLAWSREDDFAHDQYQSASIVRMRAGVDGEGQLVGWTHRVSDFNLNMYGPFDPNTFAPAAENEPWGGIDTPYAFANFEATIARQESPVRTGPWRSVFYPSSVFARECFLDELAVAMGVDPLVLRLDLLKIPDPVTRGGQTFDNRARLRAVLSLAAEKGGWGQLPTGGEAGRRMGRGMACNIYHGRTVIAHVAEVSVGAKGDVVVHRLVCAMDCGRVVSVSGTEAQIEGAAIWALSSLFGKGITFAGGRTQQTSFASYPVLRMGQAPSIQVHLLPSSLPPFGVGEQGVPSVVPAVLNALFAATGTRVRQVPIKSLG